MKVSLNWLKQYVDIDIPLDELCNKMVMTGFEIEELIDLSATMNNVKVGRIVKLERHPDADRLQICAIDIGDGTVQIVTGADNVFEGALVPAALHKSLLPNGTKITKGKLRGVVSEGMLCSGEELCLKDGDFPGAGVDGIMILADHYIPGTDMREVLGLDDVIIDFAITANRPDCQSMTGIAREVAVALDTKLRLTAPEYKTCGGDVNSHIRVTVEDSELCPRYYGRVVTNVRMAPSPEWMQKRLRNAGMRPINNLVDITNYVMLETGQPMHAFDMRDVRGSQIIVRRAGDGEPMTTLDGREHKLNADMLVIADAEQPSCLAGVMGSLDSEIKEDTTAVFLESAKFRRDSVRRTARALGIRTESSARFEKGLDILNVEYAMERALHLIYELDAGDIVDGAIDCNAGLPAPRELIVEVAKINERLGLDISADVMVGILNALQIDTKLTDNKLICQIPSFRDDIEGSADISEEIIRIYGYSHVVGREIEGSLSRGRKSHDRICNDLIKRRMVSQGLYEIATYSFITAKAANQLGLTSGDVRRKIAPVLNPISEEMAEMRTQLTTSMLSVLSTNHSRRVDEARFFEIGKQFLPHSLPLTEQPEERAALCIGLMGEHEDFYALKGVVEDVFTCFGVTVEYTRGTEPFLHPGRQAAAVLDGEIIGTFGELHPNVATEYGLDRAYTAELRLDMLYAVNRSVVRTQALPRYPGIERDLALICDEELPAADMERAIRTAGGALLESVALFDVYQGSQIESGKKSVAWRLLLRRTDTTLTDDEAEAVTGKIVAELEKIECNLR